MSEAQSCKELLAMLLEQIGARSRVVEIREDWEQIRMDEGAATSQSGLAACQLPSRGAVGTEDEWAGFEESRKEYERLMARRK